MRPAGALLTLMTVACASGPPGPARLDTRSETCASCRMTISDARTAGQLVAPSEEPLFFDDIGCLGGYVRSRALPRGAVAYVADHRTRAWIPATTAVYTSVAGLDTPMASHLMAHADAASRDADPDAKGGSPRASAEVFGPGGPPGGGR